MQPVVQPMQWNDAKDLIVAASRIVAVTHVSPDGDAIGSLMALTLALRDIGKDVTPVVDGGVPPYLQFIPGWEGIRTEVAAVNDAHADLVISLDASDVQRIGEVGKAALALGVPLIMLDHHRTNTLFGTVNLLNIDAPASAEVVLDLIDQLEIKLTPEIARCLLTGIVTDTLCFRVSSVTGDTLGKAHRLMAAGASLSTITQKTVMRRSTASFRLWAQVMPTIQIADHVIWVVIDQAARQAAHYDEEGDGGLVGLLIEADEAYVSASFREKADGKVELGFRSVPGFQCGAGRARIGRRRTHSGVGRNRGRSDSGSRCARHSAFEGSGSGWLPGDCVILVIM